MSSDPTRPVSRTWRALTDETPLGLLDPSTQLLPCKHARFLRRDGRLDKIDLGGRTVTLDEASAQRIDALLGQLDGARTLAEAARALDWPLDDMLETAQELYLVAAVVNVSDTPVHALTYAHHVDQYVKCVQVRMSESIPSLLDALERAPSRRLLLGSLVEDFHFISSAASHISPAIARAPNDNLRMMFSEYLAGEYWHGQWLRQGLLAAGISDAQLDHADPLPATMGAINVLRSASSNDLLAYSACLAASELEGGAKSAERVERYFGLLAKMDLLPELVLRPFKLHALDDCGADHHSYASEAFAISPPLSRAQQDSVRRTVLMLQRSVGEQVLQIVRYYSGEGAPVFTVD